MREVEVECLPTDYSETIQIDRREHEDRRFDLYQEHRGAEGVRITTIPSSSS